MEKQQIVDMIKTFISDNVDYSEWYVAFVVDKREAE